MNKEGLTKVSKFISCFFVLISLYFLYIVLIDNYSDIKEYLFHDNLWLIIVGMSIIYFLLISALPLAWKLILYGLDVNVTFKESYYIFGTSQIAKYLPSNVIHYVGRYILASNMGISKKKISISIIIETILLLFSALTIYASIIISVWFLFINFVIIFLFIYKYYYFILSYIIYTFFTFCSGVFVYCIIKYIGDVQTIELFLYIIAYYSVSWVAGYLIVGAPGGIGVREASFIFLLGTILAEPLLIISITIFRVISLASELVMFVIAVFSVFLKAKI